MALTSYYSDDLVVLYHGDCREVTEWLAADVLVTDPPYGRNWKQGTIKGHGTPGRGHHAGHEGIAGDEDTAVRDAALAAWGARPAIAFGDLMLPPPRWHQADSCVSQAIERGATRGDWRLPARR